MKVLRRGDVFYGKSHADMINKAVGTNYRAWMRSSVDLDDFGCPGMIAWFVYMDGSEHGYEDGWVWVNKLSMDGKEIDEYNISRLKTQLKEKRSKDGYYPYRLAFQLDPYGDGDKHCCRFVGAFRFKSFIRKDASAVTYEKVMDDFRLAGKGEYGACLNRKEDLKPQKGKYNTPLEEMGFSEDTYQLLRRYVNFAGDLLEFGVGVRGPLAEEIQERVYECFKDEQYI